MWPPGGTEFLSCWSLNIGEFVSGIVELCDLGFASALAAPGEPYMEYVATRWYRAPELLVTEHRYGPEVDIWAIGCLFAEMLTGDPLFPGDSDIDQLALIVKTVGKLAPRHQQVVAKLASGMNLSGLGHRTCNLPGTGHARDLLAACLRTEPRARPSANALLRHKYFVADGFSENFNAELRKKLGKEIETPSASKQGSAPRLGNKPRHQWTLNIIPDQSRSTTDSTAGESLIDYKYAPSSETNVDATKTADKKPAHICPLCPNCYECQNKTYDKKVEQSSLVEQSLPPTKAQQQKAFTKALNDTFQNTFSIPVNNFPKTPYIKKVNNKLILDEDILRGRAGIKKLTKKTPADISLPYVPGASNSPMKRVKKPVQSSKGSDTWEGARGTEPGMNMKTPTNLPYM
ncbi:protein kinase domain-containing protein [Phthorimaea operculella]|nr:protein kinase domain-containing protein [Phthorimaea operculella]